MTAPALMTAEELERLPETGERTELERGHFVVREPPDGKDVLPGFTCVLSEVMCH